MAAEIPRTVADDARDALAALDAAARELDNWRAHLRRLESGPSMSTALEARRCARIVDAVVGEAKGITGSALGRMERAERHLQVASPASGVA